MSCSESGFIDLSTGQECSDAVKYAISFNEKAHFNRKIYGAEYPKGCYILDAGAMYFNSHSSGKNNTKAHNICKKGNM